MENHVQDTPLIVQLENNKANHDFIVGTWWNHEIVKAKAQISAISGRIIEQTVTFIGKDQIIIGDKTFNTLHFNFKSSDIGAFELDSEPDIHLGHLISFMRLLNLASSFSFSKLYRGVSPWSLIAAKVPRTTSRMQSARAAASPVGKH